MIIPGYIVSVCVGWILIRIVLKDSKETSCSLLFFLAMGLGLGISAHIVFFTLLVFQSLNKPAVVLIHAALLLCLLYKGGYFRRTALRRLRDSVLERRKELAYEILILAFVMEAALILFQIAGLAPHGHWDAWAVWNVKTKFIIFGGTHWKQLFGLHWHTQPDYPLLMPLIHAWGWLTHQGELHHVTMATGVYFTAACSGLLLTSLNAVIRKSVAFLGGTLLLFLPAFYFIGTSQYADIVLAYYLLAGTVSLFMALKRKSSPFLFLAGLYLGLMSFSKNEGIIISLLLAGLASLYIWHRGRTEQGKGLLRLRFLFTGFLITGLATLIHKIALAPPNRDIIWNVLGQDMRFFNLESLWFIIKYFFFTLADPRYCLTGYFVFFLFVLSPARYIRGPALLFTVFFLLYGIIIIFIYLTTVNFDLSWRISRTLPRILINLTPALLFIHFTTLLGGSRKQKE